MPSLVAPGKSVEVGARTPDWVVPGNLLRGGIGNSGVTPGVLGSGGLLPNGASAFSAGAGAVVEVMGTGMSQFGPFFDVRFGGTSNGSDTIQLSFSDNAAGTRVPASVGQTFNAVFWTAVVAGSLNAPPLSQCKIVETDFNSLFGQVAGALAIGGTLSLNALTLTTTVSGITSAVPNITIIPAVGAFNFTLRIANPSIIRTA